MNPASHYQMARLGPKLKQKHHSYDESVDEPAKLIEAEPVDVEAETPADENEPIEGDEEDGKSQMPAFEE
jgi:hypothetical protein